MSSSIVAFFALFVAAIALYRALGDHLFSVRRIKKLRRRTLELERMLKRRATLANEVAHEIRNPLTAILCSAETLDLLVGPKLDPDQQASIRYIKEYGDQILRLVSDFIDVSRAEGGHLEAHPQAVRALPLIQSIVGLLQTNAHCKQITIDQTLVEADLQVQVDNKHLKQIVFNLLHNAIKFTPGGGHVQVIATSKFPEPWATITVRDNGPGIEPDEMPYVFDAYASGERGLREGDAGTGLGLSLVKSLVDLAGGMIEVSSTPGVGTSFEIRLPISETPVATQSSQRPVDGERAPARPLVGQSFLIVDEDLGSREAVARLIEAWGGMVDRVAMAADAVDALGKKTYDAVMIDDAIDGVDGCELARLIREEVQPAKTTIIVTTRKGVEGQDVRDAGADKVIQKPLNGTTLLESLINAGKFSITH